MKDILNECDRILVDDVGLIYINHTTKEQLKVNWYTKYIPNTIEKYGNNYMDIKWIINELNNIGYIEDGIITQKLKETLIEPTVYFAHIPTIEPIWQYVDDDELNNAKSKVSSLSQEELEIMRIHTRKNMMEIGLSTNIIAVKNYDRYQEFLKKQNETN